MVNTDGYKVLSLTEEVGDIKFKGGVAVFPLPCKIAVYINAAVHINALKTDSGALPCLCGVFKKLSVPACGGLVKIFRIVNEPVMGNVHSVPVERLGILGVKGIFGKFPVIAEKYISGRICMRHFKPPFIL